MQGEHFQGTRRYPKWEGKNAGASGFRDAEDNDLEHDIDLNEELIQNKAATYIMRVRGDAMSGAGIYDGDMIVVDRSLKPVSGKVVIAQLNGEMLIRRLEKTFNKMRLLPDTPRLAPIEVDAACDSFNIWGVVTYTIHAV